jgi:copper(I)-binding protein
MERRRFLLPLLAAPLGLVVPAAVRAHGYKTRSLEISHPWTVEQSGGGMDIPIFMAVRNKGKAPDALLRVETPDALAVAFMDQGKVLERIAFPPGQEVALHRKGPHILLKGFRHPLYVYENIFITLVFAKAGRMKVEVAVEDFKG